MKYNALALSILCLAAVSPAVRGQSPVSKLNCNQPGLFVDDLVTFCQLREVTLPSADSFTVDAVNGGVSVETWDGPGILVRAKVQTAAADGYLAEALASQVVVDTSTGNVVVTGPSTNAHQNFPVQIPAGWGLFGRSLSFDVGSGAFPGSAIRMAATMGTIQLRRMD